MIIAGCRGLEEYSKLLEQKKQEILEINQRHIKDIEHYQHEIERVLIIFEK